MVSWGITPVLVKVLPLDGLALALYRMWLAAAFTYCLLLLRKGRLTRRDFLASLPGGLSLGTEVCLFYSAVKITTVSNAVAIGNLTPIPLLLLAPKMFNERVTLVDVIWMIAALGGTSAIIYGSSQTLIWNAKGDLLAFGAMLTFSAYILASKWARKRTGALEYQSAMMIIGAIVVTPVALVYSGTPSVRSSEQLLLLLLLALIPGTGHLLMNWAHPHLHLKAVSALSMGVPAVGALGAFLILQEPILAWQALGLTVVMISLTKLTKRTKETKQVSGPTRGT